MYVSDRHSQINSCCVLGHPKANHSADGLMETVPIVECDNDKVWMLDMDGSSYKPKSPVENPTTSRECLEEKDVETTVLADELAWK
mmetsp:Transcript_19399/g.41897  ORF Transcript_19399/g.41897 Transcript_19399/m.41897 type:complete len:86 (-) Transcript_19399:844-1101(-)